MSAANASTDPRGARYRHIVFTSPGRHRPFRGKLPPAISLSSRSVPALPRDAFPPEALPPAWTPARAGSAMTAEESLFLSDLFSRAGLEMRAYRPETLRRRLPACLRALRCATIRQGRQCLDKSPEMTRQAIEAAVIGVTAFFRDAEVFEYLAGEVMRHFAGRRTPLRIWSAGCSDGQELYSIAMLLSENDLLKQSELLGTDCRDSAVAQARLGCYDEKALRDMRSERRERFLRPFGARHQIIPALMESAHWRRSDVTSFAEPGPWDLVCCRNLTMYLQPAVTSAVWHRLEQSLRPGGFLVLGKAERPVAPAAGRLVEQGPCIYRKMA